MNLKENLQELIIILKCTSTQPTKSRENDIEQKMVYLIRYATEKKWLDETHEIPTNKMTKPV